MRETIGILPVLPVRVRQWKEQLPPTCCALQKHLKQSTVCVLHKLLLRRIPGHYGQQAVSRGRHDITKGIIPSLWQYVRRGKPKSIPIGSLSRIRTQWLPSMASHIPHYRCICSPYLSQRQRNLQYATRMPAGRLAARLNLSNPWLRGKMSQGRENIDFGKLEGPARCCC